MTIGMRVAAILAMAAVGLAQPVRSPIADQLDALLNAHAEIRRNPGFYLDGVSGNKWDRQDHATQILDLWRDVMVGLAAFAAFGAAFAAITWMIRTLIDYRRWIRLVKVQMDVHAKLLDRFTGHDDLLAYVQSPAGSKFLCSPRRSRSMPGLAAWVRRWDGFSGRCKQHEVAQPLHAIGVWRWLWGWDSWSPRPSPSCFRAGRG